MATELDIEELRRVTDTPDITEPYTDEFMSDLIDTKGSIAGAAAVIWKHKAAQFATAVDMTESGSSRKLSDLHKNALTMAATYDQASVVHGGSGSGVVQIERP
jgi:hypothetical protein